MDLAISLHREINSRHVNFVPLHPLEKGDFAMKLDLCDGAKFRYEAFLRVDREYNNHEMGLMEALERFSSRKYEEHLRVVEVGDMGMETLVDVLRRREVFTRLVERGKSAPDVNL